MRTLDPFFRSRECMYRSRLHMKNVGMLERGFVRKLCVWKLLHQISTLIRYTIYAYIYPSVNLTVTLVTMLTAFKLRTRLGFMKLSSLGFSYFRSECLVLSPSPHGGSKSFSGTAYRQKYPENLLKNMEWKSFLML